MGAEHDCTPFHTTAITGNPHMAAEGPHTLDSMSFLDLGDSGSEQSSLRIPTADTEGKSESDTSGTFDTIPNEVLELIFAFCVNREPDTHMNTLDPRQAPLALAKVNRRWRSIALARKSLWCNIIIQRPWGVRGVYTVPATRPMLRLLLSRSKPLPLTIYFAPGDGVALIQAVKNLLPLLAASSPRWRDVHFKFPSVAFLSQLTCIAEKLPLLERISIQVNKALSSRGDQCFDMFKVAPALIHATMKGFKRINQIPLPFSQLVEYDGVQGDWASLLKVGRKLESCRMELGTSYPIIEGPLVHHRLKSLHIPATFILGSMEVSSLTELTVHCQTDRADSMDLSFLVDFIQRSCCKLKRLTTRNVVISDRGMLASFLEHLSHLQSLNIIERSPATRWYFLCSLLTIGDHAPVLPCLEELTFGNEDPMDMSPPSPSALGELLRSRFIASPRFSAVVSRSLLPLGVKSLGLEEGLMERLKIVELSSIICPPSVS